MKPELNQFFKEERKRVYEPGPYFVQRVMARWAELDRERRFRENSVWEIVLNARRPVLALALTLLLALVALELLVPIEPRRGIVEAYLVPESVANRFFFLESVQATPEVVEHMVMVEDEE